MTDSDQPDSTVSSVNQEPWREDLIAFFTEHFPDEVGKLRNSMLSMLIHAGQGGYEQSKPSFANDIAAHINAIQEGAVQQNLISEQNIGSATEALYFALAPKVEREAKRQGVQGGVVSMTATLKDGSTVSLDNDESQPTRH